MPFVPEPLPDTDDKLIVCEAIMRGWCFEEYKAFVAHVHPHRRFLNEVSYFGLKQFVYGLKRHLIQIRDRE